MNNKFLDNRGTLFFPIKNNKFNFSQCTISKNKLNVFRGLHANPFDKLVTCINGKILDIVVNLFDKKSDDYLMPKYYLLDPNTELFEILVPKNYAHGFLSLEENSILTYHFNGEFTPENTTHISYLDPQLNISEELNKFYSGELILSEADKKSNFLKKKDYLVFGSNGFLGSTVLKYIEKDNYLISNLRLHEIDKIENLLKTESPKYVINCAGLTGSPNIFWCDEHKTETIETNLTYQLTLANLCKKYNIHLTVFGSGGIFENDRFYSENEKGNFKEGFYTECRINLENIIRIYENVLYLRVNYPLSSSESPKNLLTKLISYKTVDDIEISISGVDELIPVLFKMIENNEVGVCNFVNKGCISLVEIKKLINDKEFQINTNLKENKRSFSKLKVEMIEKYGVSDVRDYIVKCVEEYQF